MFILFSDVLFFLFKTFVLFLNDFFKLGFLKEMLKMELLDFLLLLKELITYTLF